MKVLAIVATKRKDGLVASLAHEALEGAKEAGHEVEEINLFDHRIEYCAGCWACEGRNACIIKDDFMGVFAKVKAADALILASPTYWSNVSGIMKSFFDRQCGLAMSHPGGTVILGRRLPLGFGPREEMRGKKIVFITACTAPRPFNVILDESRSAIGAMNNYARKIKAKVVARIVYSDSRFDNDKTKARRYSAKAFGIGRGL